MLHVKSKSSFIWDDGQATGTQLRVMTLYLPKHVDLVVSTTCITIYAPRWRARPSGALVGLAPIFR